jgi:hypothetical protein
MLAVTNYGRITGPYFERVSSLSAERVNGAGYGLRGNSQVNHADFFADTSRSV